jgi:lipopolysaccharide transport system ATP-binding protein
VKRYSSGMYVRLAFAVAAHLDPEILIVDEVLAVGDIQFQKKCLGAMGNVAKNGRTVIFVSHNMGAVRRLCSRAILLEKGKIRCDGGVSEVVSAYENLGIVDTETVWNNPQSGMNEGVAFLEQIELMDENLSPKSAFFNSENIFLQFTVTIKQSNPDLKIGFDLVKGDSTVFRSQQVDTKKAIGVVPAGTHRFLCKIPAYLLNSGDYYIVPLMSIHCVRDLIDFWKPVLKITVSIDPSTSDFHVILDEKNHPGGVFPMLDWTSR